MTTMEVKKLYSVVNSYVSSIKIKIVDMDSLCGFTPLSIPMKA